MSDLLGNGLVDYDVTYMNWQQLQNEVTKLRAAVRHHRDSTPEAARSELDRNLYQVLPDEQTVDGRTA